MVCYNSSLTKYEFGEWNDMIDNTYIYIIGDDGQIYTYDDIAQNYDRQRPLISLKADTQFTGIGTYEDPFVLKVGSN